MQQKKHNNSNEIIFKLLIILNTLLLIGIISFLFMDSQDNTWRHVKILQEIENVKTLISK